MEEYSGAKTMEESACREINLCMRGTIEGVFIRILKDIVEECKNGSTFEIECKKWEDRIEIFNKEYEKQSNPETATGQCLRNLMCWCGIKYSDDEGDEIIRQRWREWKGMNSNAV